MRYLLEAFTIFGALVLSIFCDTGAELLIMVERTVFVSLVLSTILHPMT